MGYLGLGNTATVVSDSNRHILGSLDYQSLDLRIALGVCAIRFDDGSHRILEQLKCYVIQVRRHVDQLDWLAHLDQILWLEFDVRRDEIVLVTEKFGIVIGILFQ